VLLESLSDDKVSLSAPREGDIDAITRYCRHSSIHEWTTVPNPYTRLDASHFVDVVVPSGWIARSPTWAVRLGPDSEAIGMVGLVAQDASAAEVGYWLAPEFRSRGLMAAAVNLVCDFGFRSDGRGLQRIAWHVYVGNTASAAVARRVRFRYEGTQRRGALQRDQRRDCWIAGLLAEDPRVPADDWPVS